MNVLIVIWKLINNKVVKMENNKKEDEIIIKRLYKLTLTWPGLVVNVETNLVVPCFKKKSCAMYSDANTIASYSFFYL